MEIMTKEAIRNEVGKTWFLADDNMLAAKLIYISGINGFDNYLGQKDQYDIKSVIHIQEKPKGIIMRIAKLFSAKEIAISYKNIKQISLVKYERYSMVEFMLEGQTIYFGLDNQNYSDILDYLKSLKKVKLEETLKSNVPIEIKQKFESILMKNTEVLPIKMDNIIASKWKRVFNYLIDSLVISIISIPFVIFNLDNQLQQSLVTLFVFLFYYLIMESAFRTTIGKLITNTRVVNFDGSRAEDIFNRTICRFIPFEPLSFLFSNNGWHDNLSKTIVIDRKLRKNYRQRVVL
ncbi:MAG: RDD family protein [Bacteroidales bacterium]|jgi:uncharacterized RDD family membrane protein YckC|nr:RDD family protein [Bacteroidales bacterium]